MIVPQDVAHMRKGIRADSPTKVHGEGGRQGIPSTCTDRGVEHEITRQEDENSKVQSEMWL
eukprot:6204916-Pleurochrysis_carterae.AAC.1